MTLEPRSEHLVWGKLPSSLVSSVGSTVIVEPTQSRSKPRHILFGRVITPLWGDGSVPVKMINPTDKTITLRRNSKIANVSPCIAVEDLPEADTFRSNVQYGQQSDSSSRTKEDMAAVLKDLELQDIDLESCEVSLA